jgi:putative inorganic carbon (HCO3(-)) transporter
MRDVTILLLLLALAWLAWRKPWTGVVGLALLGAMHPQTYGGEWAARLPVYKVLFVVTCLAAAIEFRRLRRWPTLPFDWRLVVLGLLFADFALTTWYAILPETARGRLIEVSMLLPPLLLALILLDTRKKLFAAVVATAAGVALVALKGGWWAIITGFSDRVYGPPTSQIGGNNEFAVALAMIIPLLVFWRRHVADRILRAVLVGAISLCYVAALTSWSRGGLLALLAMSVLLVWHSQHKVIALIVLAAGATFALGAMSEKWQARMETIGSYQADQSFQGRVDSWKKGLAYVERDPWTGSGFDGWLLLTAAPSGGNSISQRDWHSAYVEALAEHGVPGFALWMLLLVGTLIELTRLAARGRRTGDPWLADFGAMLRAALVAYLIGGLTLGIATWELLFQLLAYALVAKALAPSLPPQASEFFTINSSLAPGQVPRVMKIQDKTRLAR